MVTAGGFQAVERIAAALADLSDGLVRNAMVGGILGRLIAHAVDLLPGVDAAGAIALDDGAVGDLAVTGPAGSTVPQRLLTLQIAADDGPSVECCRTGAPISDWRPKTGTAFDTACRQAGFASLHVVPMLTRGDSIGSLTLFRAAPGELDRPTVVIAKALAAAAATRVRHQRLLGRYAARVAQLQEALHSRVLIEQAKGVIAERTGVEPDDAFVVIRRYARRKGLRLHDVARLVIDRALDISGE